MNLSFVKLNKSIIKCSKCPRLVDFRNKISNEKRKQYQNETYWGKPITGFGDVGGKLLFVGLAPAAHGGTRTCAHESEEGTPPRKAQCTPKRNRHTAGGAVGHALEAVVPEAPRGEIGHFNAVARARGADCSSGHHLAAARIRSP